MRFEPRHNMIALLDTDLPEASSFLEIIAFIRRSRIYTALTAEVPLCISHLTSFWNTAVYHGEMDPPAITAVVDGRSLELTENALRTALNFSDETGDPTDYPYLLIQKVFARMGYSGEFSDSQLRKAKLPPQWRFLVHLLIHCISPRKTGFDGIGRPMQSAVVALVLNKKFNFT